VVPPKGIGREFLLAKGTPGHAGVVLPAHDRLLQPLPLIALPRDGPPPVRAGLDLVRRQIRQELGEPRQALLQARDLQERPIDRLLPHGLEGVGVIAYQT